MTQGIVFHMENLPSSIERTSDGRLKVTFSKGEVDVFDTVLAAVGNIKLQTNDLKPCDHLIQRRSLNYE